MRSNTEDRELARSLLEEEKWNLVVVKDGQIILSSSERGVAPFFRAVRSMADRLKNGAMADRVVGSAVAMLCVHAGIASVYAATASRGAIDMLERHGVSVSSREVVPHISNRAGTDLCPFEILARDADSPAQLLSSLESVFGGTR
ncbi:MAG: DUF1893 domain-containing protein [Dehalococcoidia bacterium]